MQGYRLHHRVLHHRGRIETSISCTCTFASSLLDSIFRNVSCPMVRSLSGVRNSLGPVPTGGLPCEMLTVKHNVVVMSSSGISKFGRTQVAKIVSTVSPFLDDLVNVYPTFVIIRLPAIEAGPEGEREEVAAALLHLYLDPLGPFPLITLATSLAAAARTEPHAPFGVSAIEPL